MKNNKYLRALVCLALVCCLIINISPIKAHALGPEWFFHQIGTDIGATGILEGLGLFRDALNGDEYYNELVSNVKHFLADSGLCTLEYMDAYWRFDPVNANPVLTIPLALVTAVRNFVFDNGVVKSDFPTVSSVTYAGVSFTTNRPVTAFAYRYNNKGTIRYYFGVLSRDTFKCKTSIGTSYTNASSNSDVNGDMYYFEVFNGVYSESHPNASEISSWPLIGSGTLYELKYHVPYLLSGVVSTSQPISLGVIAPSSTLFSSAYPQWLEHQRELEDGSTETVVQIGLGNTQVETESLTQEQIWSGQGTVSVPDTEEDEAHVPVTLPEWLQQGLDNLRLGLQDISSTLLELPAAIAEKVAAVFIPSTDYLTAKVEALRGEFGFIDSVIATGEFIRDSVSGASGPPVIYVDLGRAPSGNYGSQRVLLTDFSWYAPYKGQVDTVLSAALWAFFGWRVFMKLPGIIGGESGYISDVFFSSSSGRSGSDDKKKGGKG